MNIPYSPANLGLLPVTNSIFLTVSPSTSSLPIYFWDERENKTASPRTQQNDPSHNITIRPPCVPHNNNNAGCLKHILALKVKYNAFTE